MKECLSFLVKVVGQTVFATPFVDILDMIVVFLLLLSSIRLVCLLRRLSLSGGIWLRRLVRELLDEIFLKWGGLSSDYFVM